MTRISTLARIAALSVGGLLMQHGHASAGMMPALLTASNGAAHWTYTAGIGAGKIDLGAVTGTDWTRGSTAPPTSTVAAVVPASLPVPLTPVGSTPVSAVPEPGTLAMLGFPLLFVAAIARRRRLDA